MLFSFDPIDFFLLAEFVGSEPPPLAGKFTGAGTDLGTGLGAGLGTPLTEWR